MCHRVDTRGQVQAEALTTREWMRSGLVLLGSERTSGHRPPGAARWSLALRLGGQPVRAAPAASPMATRVLTMTARLGPVQQPEEPVFAQLKPVLGAREAAIFPGEDLKQQQPPPPQQQHPGGGGGGGGATLPAEEMVQVGSGHRSQPAGGHSVPAQPPAGAAAAERAGLGGAGLRGEGGGQRSAGLWWQRQ